MKFRTEIKCPEVSKQIDHRSGLVLLGSCFSEHMEDKFQYYKFKTFANPFGILFHPRAIEKAVQHCVTQKYYCAEDLIKHHDTWLSLDHHSQFDQRDHQQVLNDINKQIEFGYHALKNASHVIITLGTSWIYKWKQNDHIVGNCHKIPQKFFTKNLLASKEIIKSLKQVISNVQEINKNASFIFTVSPVRHLKDGFTENTLSKSLLHQAIHELTDHKTVSYFPAYEIMMDDLRDYRFYKNDLVHPNEMAVDYIWELFKNSWISKDSRELMNEVEDIQKSRAHRAFDPESEAHKIFLEKLELKIRALQSKHPQIKFPKKEGND